MCIVKASSKKRPKPGQSEWRRSQQQDGAGMVIGTLCDVTKGCLFNCLHFLKTQRWPQNFFHRHHDLNDDLSFLFLGNGRLLLPGNTDPPLTLAPPTSSSACPPFLSSFLSARRRPASLFSFPFPLFSFLAQRAVTCRVCDYLRIFFNLPHLCSQHRPPLSQLQISFSEKFFTI